MKLEADVRSLIAKLQATLAGSSEGRGVLEPPSKPDASLRNLSGAGRPSLEPASWHARYRALLQGSLRKELARKARRKHKAWLEAEQARRDRRAGKTYGPDGSDPFRGFRS